MFTAYFLCLSALLRLCAGDFWRVGDLRNQARTSSQLWLDSVVPLGESFAAMQSKWSHLTGCGLEAARIESAVEISSDLKSGLGLGGAGIVKDLLVGVQRFARPVA